MLQRPVRLLLIAVAALVFFAGPALIGFYTDWLWFGEVGYQQVFLTMLGAQATLFVMAFVISAVWLAANLRLALATVGDLRPVFTTREGIEVPLPGRQQLGMIASGLAAALAGVIALFASSQWETWLAWRYAVPFDQADPILGRDAAFYVFSLPFFQFCSRSRTGPGAPGGPWSRGALFRVRQRDIDLRGHAVDDARSAASSLAARRGVPGAPGVRRLAGPGGAAHPSRRG